jgi:hypothetical protein
MKDKFTGLGAFTVYAVIAVLFIIAAFLWG